jgi:Lrp/AsnC family leucine-responsive transcriptional regulator
MDQTERKILALLQADGRMSNVELAERVGLSESPTFRRVKQLEGTDQRRLGLEVTAFVLVTMERQPDSATESFHACVAAEEHVIECHAMSGSHDYLMKVVARNIDHFSEICMQRILKFPGVMHVESSFSLKEIKHSQVLPA